MSSVAVFRRPHEPLAEDLEDTFREHSRLVYRTAYSVTGSAQDAEDVVQSLFLQLLRRGLPPAFKDNPKGYLYRAAVNLSLNAVKSRRRRAAAVDPDQLEATDRGNDEHEASVARDALQARLVDAIATLNPRAVEMLILRYEHDTSEAEIGRLLGTSRAVVAVTLFRARARLKKLLRASASDRRGRPSGRPEE
jgi:RNA polymerase sigma-70 factor, ECF subfamily